MSKYKHALEIKATNPALIDAMQDLKVTSKQEFEGWLAEEKECIGKLLKEPVLETLSMDYYRKLVSLDDLKYVHLSAGVPCSDP